MADRTVSQLHERAPDDLKVLYDNLEQYLLAIGDDVTKTVRKNYYAFRRIKNFACVEIHPQTRKLLVYLKVDPARVGLARPFKARQHDAPIKVAASIAPRRPPGRRSPGDGCDSGVSGGQTGRRPPGGYVVVVLGTRMPGVSLSSVFAVAPGQLAARGRQLR